MPKPVSSTLSTASPPSARSATRIRPPAGVYFTALVRMLVSTCSSRTASPSTHTGSVLISICRSSPGVAANVATAWRTSSAMSSGCRFSRIFPETTRSTSSRSSIRREMWPTCRAITSCARRRRLRLGRRHSSTWTAVLIAPSGLRSSWASIARNSSFVRLSRSARSRSLLASRSSRQSVTIRFRRSPPADAVVVSDRLTSKDARLRADQGAATPAAAGASSGLDIVPVGRGARTGRSGCHSPTRAARRRARRSVRWHTGCRREPSGPRRPPASVPRGCGTAPRRCAACRPDCRRSPSTTSASISPCRIARSISSASARRARSVSVCSRSSVVRSSYIIAYSSSSEPRERDRGRAARARGSTCRR